jgi:hypothetical protein
MMRRVTSRLRDRIAGRDSWHFAKERFVGGKDIIRPSSLFGDARPAMLDALHHSDRHLKGVHVGKAYLDTASGIHARSLAWATQRFEQQNAPAKLSVAGDSGLSSGWQCSHVVWIGLALIGIGNRQAFGSGRGVEVAIC